MARSHWPTVVLQRVVGVPLSLGLLLDSLGRSLGLLLGSLGLGLSGFGMLLLVRDRPSKRRGGLGLQVLHLNGLWGLGCSSVRRCTGGRWQGHKEPLPHGLQGVVRSQVLP